MFCKWKCSRIARHVLSMNFSHLISVSVQLKYNFFSVDIKPLKKKK